MDFMVGYAISKGIEEEEATSWAIDLKEIGKKGAYFFSMSEYIFTATKAHG